MANISRTLGWNIQAYMSDANINTESFAHKMDYSNKDVINIIEGKKIIPPFEIKRIAETLGIEKEKLLNSIDASAVPQLQFRKRFSNLEHIDFILDLMDEYVELCEVE